MLLLLQSYGLAGTVSPPPVVATYGNPFAVRFQLDWDEDDELALLFAVMEE